ncbi:phage tail protein [Undibacterium flavidum]|uniref:Phage tail protein n=1 Tax=Undibacterium flavidum TaxID=2762297 RepID=A0ABR6YAS9_9BURK|nr:tail fiber protein [Undibacterium flavidum]MBC3873666.1 phage tail protein [Undibacterium flavidum]
MSSPFLSEIRIFTFSFAPRGWAFCNGQFLPINQNQGLFSLLGTTYGGDGRTTFALPNLQGRTPIHVGNGHSLGESAGSASNTLAINQIPGHTHLVRASNDAANLLIGDNALIAKASTPNFSDTTPGNVYESTVAMQNSVTSVGGSQAHLNLQPFLTLNICIALQGIFPSAN